MKIGIDVSENNGVISWQDISGIDFVIVRSSFGSSQKDNLFEDNVNGAHSQGFTCGAYHYGYALTPDEAVKEAQNCLNVIQNSGLMLEHPIFYDMEDADHYKANNGFDFSSDNIQAICKAFCDTISAAGLKTGIYASYSWITSYGIDTIGYPIWNAQWSTQNNIPDAQFWQYTDSYGINGVVFDGDYLLD